MTAPIPDRLLGGDEIAWDVFGKDQDEAEALAVARRLEASRVHVRPEVHANPARPSVSRRIGGFITSSARSAS